VVAPARKQRIGKAPPAPAVQRKAAYRNERTAAQIRARAISAGFRYTLPRSNRFVITSAQDGSPLHEGFFGALLKYCELNDAELVVIPYLYRALQARKQEEKEVHAERWSEALRPYLFAGRFAVNQDFVIMGDVKISPTKQSPLSALDSMTLGASAVFGHPKLELKTVPTLNSDKPTILTTTGVVTQTDYVDALSSKIAEFHHTQGAIVVETDGDWFTLRQLNASTDTGEFTDLDTHYSANGARKAERPLALVLGDTHVGATDPIVEAATFGKTDSIVAVLRPQHIVYHDLLDGYSMNPHHNDPFLAVAKQGAGKNKVRAEVEAAARFVQLNTPRDSVPVVVASNHDDFLNRWMRSADWRELGDQENALFYLETAAKMVAASKVGPGGYEGIDPFHVWAKRICPRAKFLGRRESFVLGGVELSLHGDVGPNGARGSIRNLRRIGTKTIIGHSHSPGISEGAMQTGTSSLLQLEYNRGPSSWAHAHAVLYASGKRALIFIRDGRWRLQ
jgi:hypothetical protein